MTCFRHVSGLVYLAPTSLNSLFHPQKRPQILHAPIYPKDHGYLSKSRQGARRIHLLRSLQTLQNQSLRQQPVFGNKGVQAYKDMVGLAAVLY